MARAVCYTILTDVFVESKIYEMGTKYCLLSYAWYALFGHCFHDEFRALTQC